MDRQRHQPELERHSVDGGGAELEYKSARVLKEKRDESVPRKKEELADFELNVGSPTKLHNKIHCQSNLIVVVTAADLLLSRHRLCCVRRNPLIINNIIIINIITIEVVVPSKQPNKIHSTMIILLHLELERTENQRPS